MNITDHFKDLQLTSEQQQAVEMIEDFLKGDDNVFILKGYAGTGKTTLIKGIVSWLKAMERPCTVMAPTGRAAKVIRSKTGIGSTIHRGIYDFLHLETIKDESQDDAEKSYKYYFPLIADECINRVAIVDEASMISSKYSEHELFRFGSGYLLSDLIEYMDMQVQSNKIIFVGDPAQLPPVGDNQSYALDPAFFEAKGYKVSATELTQITRQKADSLILENAGEIRQLLNAKQRNSLIFKHDDNQCRSLRPEQICSEYLLHYPAPEIGDGLIITYSNSQALNYNKTVRQILYPQNPDVIQGDILLINNNNYHTYGADLYNGDMVKVLEVAPQTETQSTPVMVGNVRKIITLTFRDVSFFHPDSGQVIICKIIDSLLNNPNRDLTIHEMKALYINFVMRFQGEQKKRAEQKLETYKVGSQQFKDRLRVDLYFNAMRVKYGYAITCHKAQGGEWQKVFVDFYGRIGLKDEQLRWCYTAITRAAEVLFTVNAPNISTFEKLKFSPIGRIGKLPSNALALGSPPATPFHGINSHPAKRHKFHEIVAKIADSAYTLSHVESRDYHEMCFFSLGEETIRIDMYHDEAGFFTKISSNDKNAAPLIELIKQDFKAEFKLHYNPGSEPLAKLWNIVQMICSELEIQITNVAEEVQYNYVNYFLKTSGICSYIQFYFKSDGRFTSALPKSDLGDLDAGLVSLIQKMNTYEL